MKIAVFTEDKYCPRFIRKVVNRLISEGYIIGNIEFARSHTSALIRKCNNVSVSRKVKAVIRDVDRIIIVIDKENTYDYDENREIWRHLKDLKEEDIQKVHVIATEPEIEEWICVSLGIDFDRTGYDTNRKPNKILERKEDYKKSKLDKYAEKLDFEKLLNSSESFKKFHGSLTFH